MGSKEPVYPLGHLVEASSQGVQLIPSSRIRAADRGVSLSYHRGGVLKIAYPSEHAAKDKVKNKSLEHQKYRKRAGGY